jgi:hypothetical protein
VLEPAVADYADIALGNPKIDGDLTRLAVVVEGHDQDRALALGQAL